MATIMKIMPLPIKPTPGEVSISNSLAEKGFMRQPGTGVGLVPLKQQGKYLTGLDPDAQYLKIMLARGGEQANTAKRLSEQIQKNKERLEIETGLDLSPRSEYYAGVYGPKFGTEEVASRVRLIDGVNVFNFESPFKEVEFWWVSQCSHLIAPSLDAWRKGECKATVQFYVSDPEAEARQIYADNMSNANAFNTLTNMDNAKRKKIAKLLGLPVTDNTIEQDLFNQLYAFVSSTSIATGEYKGRNPIQLFNTICSFDDTKLNVSATVAEAIKLSILFDKGGVIYNDNQVVASSKDVYIEELCSPTKQTERMVLEMKVADKKKLGSGMGGQVIHASVIPELVEKEEAKRRGRPPGTTKQETNE